MNSAPIASDGQRNWDVEVASERGEEHSGSRRPTSYLRQTLESDYHIAGLRLTISAGQCARHERRCCCNDPASTAALSMTAMVTDGKYTRDVVLATALEIIDRDGADALSMRRLARALGRDPMILYRHAPNKAALLEGVAETVLTHLKVDPADPDWAAQLRSVARDYRQLALAHPNVVPLLVTRPLATPLGLRPRGHPAPPGRRPHPAHPRRASAGSTPCTSTGPCSASCTATSSTSSRNSSPAPTRPTTCCGWACTGCRSANSPCSAASPPPWPPTTAPPNSNAASTSCSPG